MIAYVSGESARGAIVRAGEINGYMLDVEQPITVQRENLTKFFMFSMDVREIECQSPAALVEKIEEAWRNDRAFRLCLIVLDAAYDISTRREAALCAEELLNEQSRIEYVSHRLYASALPKETDSSEILGVVASTQALTLERVFQLLVARQESIRSCISAWESIPADVFDSDEDRERMRLRVIDTGAFYRFAATRDGDNNALFRLLTDRVLSASAAKTRALYSHWASKYRELPKALNLTDDVVGSSDNEPLVDSETSSVRTYNQVRAQQDAIKRTLQAGDRSRAWDLIEDLVSFQRAHGESEYLAKSLCHLATFAKSLGDSMLSFELSERATKEAQSDAWSFGQFGNALLERGDYSRAMDAFQRTRQLGDERTALLGMAETFKYLGNKTEALALLDLCSKQYPLDSVSRNSAASALAFFGEFAESLKLYQEITSSPLADSHSFAGMASVLGDMGRIEEAIKAIDSAIFLAPSDNTIPLASKVDIYREAGFYDEAFSFLSGHLAEATLPVLGALARLHRDAGDFESSMDVLTRCKTQYPYDPWTQAAIAELYRKQGDNEKAIACYEQVESDFARSWVAKNSLAALYAASGEPERALTLLPRTRPSTRGDWIGQHLRASILTRMGDFSTARELILEGMNYCPWIAQRPYFLTALAMLDSRQASTEVMIRSIMAADNTRTTREASALLQIAKLKASAVARDSGSFAEDLVRIREIRFPIVVDFVSFLESRMFDATNESDFLSSAVYLDRELATVMALAA